MIVDVHMHCYPEPYVKELKKAGIGDDGGIGVKIPLWGDTEQRIAQMDEMGIDVQVLNLSAPNVYCEDPELSKDLAQISNDFMADICRKYPDRFLSLASVPLNRLSYALDEMDRSMDILKMDGILLGTNVNQRPLSNNEFEPFFEALNQRKVPIALHPIKAIGEDLMPPEYLELTMAPSVGFLFETTRTMAQMTFKGWFEKYPDLIFILPHLGGAVPFLWPRWDMTYQSRPEGHPLKQLPHRPSYYLKRHYYDTALSFHHATLKCTLDLADADHIVFGTDGPYGNDFRTSESIKSIQSFDVPEEDRAKILAGNAIEIFAKLKTS